MPDQTTSQQVIGSRSLRDTFNDQLKTATEQETAPSPAEVEKEKVAEPAKKDVPFVVDDKLPPEERMEKLLEVDQDALSPADLVKFKKELHKGFTQATQRAAKRVSEAEGRASQLQEQVEQYDPLMKLWDQDEGFRQHVTKYVQERSGASDAPRAKSGRMEKFLSEFSPEQRKSLESFYEAIREDVLQGARGDDPVARQKLEALESEIVAERQVRIAQDVERMERRFNESCPTYKEQPAFVQNLFEKHLRAEFSANPNTDPVEVYRAFEKELAAFSSKDRSTQLDELAARPARVPPPSGGSSGTSEPKFTPGKVFKEAFDYHLKRRA